MSNPRDNVVAGGIRYHRETTTTAAANTMTTRDPRKAYFPKRKSPQSPNRLNDSMERVSYNPIPTTNTNTTTHLNQSYDHDRSGLQARDLPASSRMQPASSTRAVRQPYSSAKPNHFPEQYTPIVFSDPFEVGSVGTGMSQQELLRTKARETRRRSAGGGIFSSKKKNNNKRKPRTIISIPSSLLARSEIEGSHIRLSEPNKMLGFVDDSQELSTAETTPSEISNQHNLLSKPPIDDNRSTSEDSFPILSRVAISGDFPFGPPQPPPSSSAAIAGSTTIQPVPKESVATTVPTPSVESLPRVRFAEEIVLSPARLHVQQTQSILREPRFKPAVSQRSSSSSLYSPAVGSLSTPPRKDFADESGQLISPIRPEPSSHWLGHPAEKILFDNRSNRATTVHTTTTSPAAPPRDDVERTNKESYPDPPLDLISMDDESTILSMGNDFLELVAAIVIQTAFRRFLAVQLLKRLLLQRQRQRHEQQIRTQPLIHQPLAEQSHLTTTILKRERQSHGHPNSPPNFVETSLQLSNHDDRDHDDESAIERQLEEEERRRFEEAQRKIIYKNLTPRSVCSTHLDDAIANTPGEMHTSPTVMRLAEYYESPHYIYDSPQRAPSPQKTIVQQHNPVSRPRQPIQSKHDSRSRGDNRIQTLRTLAATRIQATFRGFWTRDSLAVDHYCAGIVQNNFRRYLCRKRYQRTLQCIVVIQRAWRKGLAQYDYTATLGAAILIQTYLRGYAVRKRLSDRYFQKEGRAVTVNASSGDSPPRLGAKPRKGSHTSWQEGMVEYSWHGFQIGEGGSRSNESVLTEHMIRMSPHQMKRELAAMIIQARYRSYVCEQRFIRTLVDILIVQTVARRWLALNRAAMIRTLISSSKNKPFNGSHMSTLGELEKSFPDDAEATVESDKRFGPEGAVGRDASDVGLLASWRSRDGKKS